MNTYEYLTPDQQLREAWSALKYALTSSTNPEAVRASLRYINTEAGKLEPKVLQPQSANQAGQSS